MGNRYPSTPTGGTHLPHWHTASWQLWRRRRGRRKGQELHSHSFHPKNHVPLQTKPPNPIWQDLTRFPLHWGQKSSSCPHLPKAFLPSRLTPKLIRLKSFQKSVLPFSIFGLPTPTFSFLHFLPHDFFHPVKNPNCQKVSGDPSEASLLSSWSSARKRGD